MLRKIFSKLLPPRGDKFLNYFNESAKICKENANILLNIVDNGFTNDSVEQARKLKQDNNRLTTQTLVFLHETYLTLIDREDIHEINVSLNKISRKIVKVISLFKIYQLTTYNNYIKAQVKNLQMATCELQEIIRNLKNFKKTNVLAEIYQRLKSLETKGDKLHQEAMEDLFSGNYDALTVIKFKDIYSNLEQSVDLCCYIAGLIVSVSLKHA